MEINAEIIKELIDTLGKAGVDRLNLETQDFKLSLEKTSAAASVAAPAPQAAVQAAAKAAPAQAPAAEQERGVVVKSPIVGTYYASASPDKPPFVTVGKQIKKGDTLFIVESMKLMNEITSEYDGTVAEILAENGKGVEYGSPVLRIE